MKPFDMKKAAAGAKVCTRDGRAVRIISFDRKDCYRPIVALIEVGDLEVPAEYLIDGRWSFDRITPKDLMLASEKKTAWVNVYRDYLGHNLFSLAYKDRESAEKIKDIYPWTYITTTEIEWKE